MKPYLPDAAATRRLMAVAAGSEPADLAVVDARVVNVYTGEILDRCSVSVADRWIAAVGATAEAGIGPETRVIDAGGRTLIPGLIDAHTHLAWLFSVSEFLPYAVAGGTTTVITETLEIYPVGRYPGTVDFLESLVDQPIKMFGTAPAMVSTSRSVPPVTEADLDRLLQRSDILGLGESYWQLVLQQPERLVPIIDRARLWNKPAQGHSAGAHGNNLGAYVAAGISSCHEAIDADQALELLRLGLHVMIREGSIRRDLEAVARILEYPVDPRRLVLVTDGISPTDLVRKGYLEYAVQKAIDLGFDPVTAVQMATLNPAEHFGIDRIAGGIAPGRCADMVLIPDPRTIRADIVISNGQEVARSGRLIRPVRRHRFAPPSRESVRLARAMTPQDFEIFVPGGRSTARVRVIDQVTELVTRERVMEVPVCDGRIAAEPGRDLIKAAAVDRAWEPGKTFVGLVHGFGLKAGAFACSSAWDTTDIIVVGTDDVDMAAACNRIRTLQGGAVLCCGGNVIREIALPIYGLMSDLPMAELAGRMDDLREALQELGVGFGDPLLTLGTLTVVSIPFFRICDQGLVNLKDGETRGLFADS